MALGVVYLIYLYATDPQRILETGRIFVEEEALEAEREMA
jgi:hypothetical protein